jgi:hypothetical protein
LKVHTTGIVNLVAMLAGVHCGIAKSAELVVVQCVVDKFRSSYAPRQDVFAMQFDMDARTVATSYGTASFKTTRREVRAVAQVWAGWQFNLNIDRRTGAFVALTDKVEHGKYSYAEAKGTCILPDDALWQR